MSRLKIGQVDYINCLPVYHALEDSLLVEDMELIRGTPAHLNKMFLEGKLDVTPLSSIEYARNHEKSVILPNLSISADGKVESILFFSKLPVIEMEGKKACVTTSSATSVALLRILFEHFYHVDVEIIPSNPDLDAMLDIADGALLIGDDAMRANWKLQVENSNLHVTDLGEAWKKFTGEKMVYAVWVVHSALADTNPAAVQRIHNLLMESRNLGWANREALVEKAHKKTGLPREIIDSYLDTIHHELEEDERRALLLFFDYAYKSGLTSERVSLTIWGG